MKLLLIRIVSTLNAHCITIYTMDFYLNTSMAQSDYMRLKLSNLPKSVVLQYNIEAKVTRDGYVHMDI